MTGDPALSKLDPGGRDAAQWMLSWLRAQGWPMIVTSAVRTEAQQLALQRNNPSGLPVAASSTSRHVLGRAFDLGFRGYTWRQVPNEYWAQIGRVWEQMGGRWGGRFGDPVHFDW